jgi:ethanolamine ammonia-lyase small subunit
MSDPWHPLRRLTAARIALGRTGGSLPTGGLLDFRLAHARARDAVSSSFDAAALAERLRCLGMDVLSVESAAQSSADYLRRPDLGRKLAASSHAQLAAHAEAAGFSPDLVVIVSDGLSSLAATEQSPPLLATLVPLAQQNGWRLAPLVVATRGRVALQDEIGGILGARLGLMLLGERPGLGAANSLGAYFTYAPRPGLTDASRNCVSNIRAEGLPPADAARKLFALLSHSLRREVSGVELKDETPLVDSLTSTNLLPPVTLPPNG